jgi:hypothetical protein
MAPQEKIHMVRFTSLSFVLESGQALQLEMADFACFILSEIDVEECSA